MSEIDRVIYDLRKWAARQPTPMKTRASIIAKNLEIYQEHPERIPLAGVARDVKELGERAGR